MLWLDVDTKIQELSADTRSLADFVRAFFGERNSDLTTHTYTFAQLCKASNRIAPFDWQTFLTTRLEAHDAVHLLDGLSRVINLSFPTVQVNYSRTIKRKREWLTSRIPSA